MYEKKKFKIGTQPIIICICFTIFRILGIIFLIFGFLTLMGSLIYCVTVCRDAKTPKEVAMQNHYWTHHWQKSFGATPEIHYKTEKYPPQAVHHSDHDEYSDRFSIGKQSDRHMPGHRY